MWFHNSSRQYLRRANEDFAKDITSDMCVLDAGAGSAPYRDLFCHAKYETADFEKVDKEYGDTSYVCDLTNIPVESSRYDRVVFNQVLEHVPDPLAVLKELHRVLKPGGRIICTCPLFFAEHEQPYDFYRYTQFAHRHLFVASGFEIDRIDWMEGFFGTAAYMFQSISQHLPYNPKRLGGGIRGYGLAPFMLLVRSLTFILAGVFGRLDLSIKLDTAGFPKNYLVLATKPGRAMPGNG